jgi:hypothetical protein
MKYIKEITPLASLDFKANFIDKETIRFFTDVYKIEISHKEMAEMLSIYPLCFYYVGNNFRLGALMSLVPDFNFFVLPSGDWATPVIPSLVRAWPFTITEDESADPLNIASSYIADPDDKISNTVAIYETESAFSEKVKLAAKLLIDFAQAREVTRGLLAKLNDLGLIVPWELKVSVGETVTTIPEIYRIDEQRILALSAEDVQMLTRQGAFAVVYAQLLSQSRIGVLQKMYKVHASAIEQKDSIAKASLTDSGKEISFDF